MAIKTTISQPTGSSLGATVNKFPKAQQAVIVDIIDTLNDAINGSISTTDLTLSGDLVVGDDATITGDLVVTSTSTFTGAIASNLATDSTSKDTGAVILQGGLGVEKSIFSGASISAATQLLITATSNQIRLGNTAANDVIISSIAPAADSIYTIPDAGVTANFVMSEGTATINGTKTFGTGIAVPDGTVGALSVRIGADLNNGLYGVSDTQLGIAVEGALVALADTSGLMSDSLRNRVNLGTTPVGTVSIVEYGDGKDITTVLTLTNFIVGGLAGAAAALGIGNIVYAFPAGQHFELVSSLSSVVLTAAGTAVATDTGLGSVIATGVISILSGTATFEDRLTGQTINTAAGGGAAVSALTAATAGIGTGISLNVAGNVKNVFLNSAATWNANNTGNLTATGTIVLKWTVM